MAEQLAFKQRIDQGGTVAHREARLAHGADLVNGAGDELFARAGGTNEENIRVMTRHLAREIEDLEHRGAFADDAVEFQILEELLLQCANAAALVVERGDIVERALQAEMIDGFRKKI